MLSLHREAQSGPGRRSAFTLVELLVVVSIIAILAAMLLPVIGMVRESSKASKCLSHQKQIHLACISYATDNEGILPDIWLTNGTGWNYWTVLTRTYLETTAAYASSSNDGSTFFQKCPNYDRTKTGTAYGLNAQLNYGNTTQPNLHNAYVYGNHGTATWTPFALASISRPSQRAYVGDAQINPTIFFGTPSVYSWGYMPFLDPGFTRSYWEPALRHRTKMVTVFVDGHGASLTYGDLQKAFSGFY